MTEQQKLSNRRETITALTKWLGSIFEGHSVSFFEEDDKYQVIVDNEPHSSIDANSLDTIGDIGAYHNDKSSYISLAFIEIGHKFIFSIKYALELKSGKIDTEAISNAYQFANTEYNKLVKSCPELIDDVNENVYDSTSNLSSEMLASWKSFVEQQARNTIKVARVGDVKLPTRGTSGSAGLDFYVPNSGYTVEPINPGQKAFIPSGIKANVPEGYALIAFNKSGVALKKDLLVGACVVDSDYQGEIHIHVVNVGTKTQTIVPGEKLVQFLLVPVSHDEIEEVSEAELFSSNTERGSGGFGSTGIQ